MWCVETLDADSLGFDDLIESLRSKTDNLDQQINGNSYADVDKMHTLYLLGSRC